ncbi:Sun protein [Salipiger mucosus DSM 16094]|uniref:Sun protein n=1 Tax=Salipiger mucosus DSM 16094 TaxID=1123237 RepID=S9S6K9_9RHOB|nr:Sun protein [Salipiger mucosus DSM 16094]
MRREDAPRGPHDLVLCDAPCSGSGAWRRAPEGKWRLTPARLAELGTIQAGILAEAATLVAPGGTLAYATCSVLAGENGAQIEAFLSAHPGWSEAARRQFLPAEGGDGFFLAQLTRSG